MSNALGKIGRCLVGVVLFVKFAWIFLYSPEHFLQSSDRAPPAKQRRVSTSRA